MKSHKRMVSLAIWVLFGGSFVFGQYPTDIPICGLTPVDGDATASQQTPQVFKGKFFYQKGNPPIQEEHSWLLYLEDTNGKVIEGATIQGDGINYDAGRGFAKPPTITEYIGNGHYKVEGIKFSVGGNWTMRFQVISEGKAEVLSFDVKI